MIFQLVRVDGEKFFDYPTDLSNPRTDRIFVEIENNKVVRVLVA